MRSTHIHDMVRFVRGGVVNANPLSAAGFRMPDQPIAFGDNVRVVTTADTESLGVAGLVGSVYRHTTPSVTCVDVVGEITDDFAFNVHFEEVNAEFWFAPELLEFVDHGARAEITLDGVPKKRTRDADGGWDETDVTGDDLPKGGFFACLFGM
ncbi:MAG: hypothetical protein ACYTGL_22800 [Planctomycetota bacterium]|jgi:hypothetical protein